MSEIIELCLAKNPAQRYATTADLIEDLQAVADGRPPAQAHKLLTLPELTVLDQETGAEDSIAALGKPSMVATPLFWIALVGWVLAGLLLLLVILLAG